MSGTTRDPGTLNQQAAHDTGLYDPTIHDNQIVAMYDTDAEARHAQELLVQSGFPAAIMSIIAREQATTAGSHAGADTHPPADTGGLWNAIRSLFVPDEDRSTFNHAITRGHAMLVVTPDRSMDRHRLVHAIESTHPLDFDAKLEEWRQAGYDTTGAASGQPTSNTATAGHAVDGGANTTPDALEARNRAGRRDSSIGAGRVRSYLTERDDTPAGFGAIEQRSVAAEGTAAEPTAPHEDRIDGSPTRPDTMPSNVGGNPNTTPGAGTSGGNSPLRK